MKIQVRLSAQRGIGSRIIRLKTWSDYSHVEYLLPWGQTIGARMIGGILIRDINRNDYHVRIFEIEVPDDFIESLLEDIGADYDFGFPLGWSFRQDWESKDKWACSEWFLYKLRFIYPAVYAERKTRVTPDDILMLMLAVGREVKF